MKKSILALVLFANCGAFAADKLAKSVTCDVTAAVAAEPIPAEGKPVSDLLANSTSEDVATFNVSCELLNKPDGRCSGAIKNKQMEVAYLYNAKSEKGTASLYDDVTGIGSETAWIKEDGVQPNYENKNVLGGMRTVTYLNSKKGGLLGRNQVFSLVVVCSPNY